MPQWLKLLVIYTIIFLSGVMCSKNEGTAPKESIEGELGKSLDTYLTRIVPFGFSGALLVAKDGEIILNKGYGMAVESEEIQNTAETVFSTGSLTKQFTAAAIMKLEMLGKLKTEDRIDRYFDCIPEDKKEITLHHLLTHSAGLPGASGRDFAEAARDETVKKILDTPLAFAPGDRFSYSNCGYSLLAAIVEIVSSQSYERFLNEKLFKPSGMDFTGYRIPQWEKKVIAHWYAQGKDNLTPLSKPYPQWNLLGNGGILSTTEDMYKWHLALKGNSILSVEAKKKMFTPYLNDYGYGWDVMETDRGLLIKHDGGSSLGIGAEFRRYLDAGIVFVLFGNRDGEKILFEEGLREKVDDIIFGGDVPIPYDVQKTKSIPLGIYSGEYKLETGGHFSVKEKNGGLSIIPIDQDAISVLIFDERKNTPDLAELNRISVELFEGILDENFRQFEALVPDPERRARIAKFIRWRMDHYFDMTGDITGVRAEGTIPGPSDLPNSLATLVVLEGERENVAFKVIWQNQNFAGLEPSMPGKILSITFMPLSATEFAGYHIGMAKNFRIEFTSKDDGTISTLVVRTSNGDTAASKCAQ